MYLFNSTPGERTQHSREFGTDIDDEEPHGAEPATPAANTEPGTATALAGQGQLHAVGAGKEHRKRIRSCGSNSPSYGSSTRVLFLNRKSAQIPILHTYIKPHKSYAHKNPLC